MSKRCSDSDEDSPHCPKKLKFKRVNKSDDVVDVDETDKENDGGEDDDDVDDDGGGGSGGSDCTMTGQVP